MEARCQQNNGCQQRPRAITPPAGNSSTECCSARLPRHRVQGRHHGASWGPLAWAWHMGGGGGRAQTCRGFVAGEGDVELAVVWQAEGAADGLGKLPVAIRPGLHLQMRAREEGARRSPPGARIVGRGGGGASQARRQAGATAAKQPGALDVKQRVEHRTTASALHNVTDSAAGLGEQSVLGRGPPQSYTCGRRS